MISFITIIIVLYNTLPSQLLMMMIKIIGSLLPSVDPRPTAAAALLGNLAELFRLSTTVPVSLNQSSLGLVSPFFVVKMLNIHFKFGRPLIR